MSTCKDLDRLLEYFVETGLPGCSLMICRQGEVIYEGFAGYANVDTKEKIRRDSIYRLASMSKLPLYTTMMMLYERGMYNMNDPIGDYLPEWKESRRVQTATDGSVSFVPTRRPLTIRDTLTMGCAMPYCNSPAPTRNVTMATMQDCMKPLWEKGHYTNREHVAAMAGAVLAGEPGERFTYGFSSELAAALVEKICGKGIDEVFQELLFDPLEMKDTASRFFGDTKERMVACHAFDENHRSRVIDMPMDDKHNPGPEHEQGWARLFSTAEDFSHLMSMLACGGQWHGKQLMGRETIDLMRTNVLFPAALEDLRDGYNDGYGYGYGVRTLVDKAAGNHNGPLGSFGWTGGFGTWCEADPEDGVSIVYMHNSVPNDEKFYHLKVRAAAYGFIR